MNAGSDVQVAQHNLLFGVRRSVRYHNRRRMHYDRLHLLTSWVAVVFGSATVVSLFSSLPKEVAAGTAALVTALASIDLVVGTARLARLHNDLARRFIDLEKAVIGRQPLDQKELATLEQLRLDIEAEEPPILRVLDVLCHNELLRAQGYGDDHFVKVGWTQRVVAQWFDLCADSIRQQGGGRVA